MQSDQNLSEIWGATDEPPEPNLKERTDAAWSYLAHSIYQAWGRGNGVDNIARFYNVNRNIIDAIINGDRTKPKQAVPAWILARAKEAGWKG